jgi:hypothetical protein
VKRALVDGGELSDISRRLGLADARESVRRLLADYGWFADTGRHNEFVALFTRDAVMEIHGGDASGTYTGRTVGEWARIGASHVAINAMPLPNSSLSNHLEVLARLMRSIR